MSTRIPDPEDPFEQQGQPQGMDLALDAKRITGDEQEGIPAPSDTPVAVDDYGTTAAEEGAGEPLDLRLSREEPELDARALDDSAQADQPYPQDVEERVGRIVEEDEGARPDTDPDAAAYDVGTDAGGFSAEERAMHVQPEA